MNAGIRRFVVLVILELSVSAQAQNFKRTWTEHLIPDQVCGNGDPYKIYVSQGTSYKVTLAFQGGGACWNHSTCFGLIKYTDLRAPKDMEEEGGIFSLNPQKSIAHDSTIVFLPYCTGDVFAGTHEALYEGDKVRHVGNNLVQATLYYLQDKMSPLFESASDLLVYGFSAGAVGAMVQVESIDAYFGYIPKKVLILDSPGLHFGETFWHKFSPALVGDYARAMINVGLDFDYDNGNVAKVVPAICRQMADWRVGVLQSTRDTIMSSVFGNISADDHSTAVLGNDGIFELTSDPNDNCSAWVPDSSQHTFLNKNKTGPKAGGISAIEYAKRVLDYSAVQTNYKL